MKIRLGLGLIRLLALLPLPLLRVLARLLGALLWLLPWRKHTVIDTNLRIAFPELDEPARRRLHRQHLVELASLALESGAVWHWPRERIERHIPEVNGWANVEAALASGRGVLVLTAHLGNWEIVNLFGSPRAALTVLYKAPAQRRLDALVRASRQRFGARLIAAGSPALRELLKRLKAGEAAAILFDQQPKAGEGEFVPFFGRPALTMTLTHRLAQRTGCELLLVGNRRLPRGRGWAIDIEAAPAALADPDPIVALTALNAWLEAQIRRAPAQYLWSYKRWALQPGGQPSPYEASR